MEVHASISPHSELLHTRKYPITIACNPFISDRHLKCSIQDAGTLRAVSGQTGTLVLDIQGQVLSATGELRGTSGEIAAETIYSMLLDSSSVLDGSQKEELRRMTITFPTYDYVVTLDAEQVYIVKRSTGQE